MYAINLISDKEKQITTRIKETILREKALNRFIIGN